MPKELLHVRDSNFLMTNRYGRPLVGYSNSTSLQLRHSADHRARTHTLTHMEFGLKVQNFEIYTWDLGDEVVGGQDFA